MALSDLFQSAATVTVETSLTPAVSFNPTSKAGEGSSASSGLSSVLMPILRPKVTVAGVTYAPYGDPLPLWPLLLVLGALLVAKKFT